MPASSVPMFGSYTTEIQGPSANLSNFVVLLLTKATSECVGRTSPRKFVVQQSRTVSFSTFMSGVLMHERDLHQHPSFEDRLIRDSFYNCRDAHGHVKKALES